MRFATGNAAGGSAIDRPLDMRTDAEESEAAAIETHRSRRPDDPDPAQYTL
jgi:hypothetical protein